MANASILCIGTELTTGQVTNRNSAWLAQRLTDLGAEVVLHETVPDDRPLMLDALKRCALHSKLVFVTGGLGPTTDDFTRDVIAEWLGRGLRYDEASWARISERLTAAGVALVDSQKQQCFYPEGARILVNEAGTANGFLVELGSVAAWVLPGPPREIASIWESNGLARDIAARLPGHRPTKLLTWQCLGKGEGELGEIVETALEGSGLVTGYRAHRPYVEIKVWCPEQEQARAKPYLEKLERAIAPWLATRQGEDLARSLLNGFPAYEEVEILDAATGGILARRLGDLLSLPELEAVAETVHLVSDWTLPADPETWVRSALDEAAEGDEDLTLAVAGHTSSGAWTLGLKRGPTARIESLKLPWKLGGHEERNRAHVCETALKLWRDWLSESVN